MGGSPYAELPQSSCNQLLTYVDQADPSCAVVIDLAGPPPSDNGVRLWSNTLREMVQALISECVARPGWGGFATYGIKDTGDGLFREDTRGYSKHLEHCAGFTLSSAFADDGRGTSVYDGLSYPSGRQL